MLDRPAFKGEDAERKAHEFIEQVRAGTATLAPTLKAPVESAQVRLELEASTSMVLKTITSAGKTDADRQAARARLLSQLAQHCTRYLMATPELTGKGRKPPEPQTAPSAPITTSKCAP